MGRRERNATPREGSNRAEKVAGQRARAEASTADTSRPFEGLAAECDIVALRNFVPSATAPLTVAGAAQSRSAREDIEHAEEREQLGQLESAAEAEVQELETLIPKSRHRKKKPLPPVGCSADWASASIVSGVSAAGLTTIVQPAAIAGPILRVPIASGKFHGVIIRHGPTGCFMVTSRVAPLGAVDQRPEMRTASSANQRKNSEP